MTAIQVTYRRTRRLSMRIVKNGDVHVSAPIGMPKKEVERADVYIAKDFSIINDNNFKLLDKVFKNQIPTL